MYMNNETLSRDRLAAMAMQGLIRRMPMWGARISADPKDIQAVADDAYRLADAMQIASETTSETAEGRSLQP
jgi:hypothetical protein